MVSDLKYDLEERDDVESDSAELNASTRAFLGCYYLSSSSVTFSFGWVVHRLILHRLAIPPKRPNSMVFSTYIDRCLSEIAANPRDDVDRMLVTTLMLEHLSSTALTSKSDDIETCIGKLNTHYHSIITSHPYNMQNHRIAFPSFL
jgi:hypothetical protein